MPRVRNLGFPLWCMLMALILSGVANSAPAERGDSLVLEDRGNRLSVKRSAPVPYWDLPSMVKALRSKPLIDEYAIVLVRNFPRSIAGYVFAVEPEGTLSLGSQLHEWEAGDQRYRLARSELVRSYQPLEGKSPWTWLVEIPISREVGASLLIRAMEGRWPVKSVSISVTTGPPG